MGLIHNRFESGFITTKVDYVVNWARKSALWLTEHGDGRIAYFLRHRWRDGTTGFLFEPGELIEKLVALIPAPRGHLVRYHGVLGPHSRWRAQVVRDRRSANGAEPEATRVPAQEAASGQGGAVGEPMELRERRLGWSQLLQRVFAFEILECPRCFGWRRMIAVITDPAVLSFCTTFYRR